MSYSRWRGPDRPVSNGAVVTRLRLEANEDAPAAARAALDAFREQTDEDVFERAQLLVSEIVTNSVVHSGADEVRLEIWRANGTVAVVAADDGPGFVPVTDYRIAAAQPGGFGLPLLNTLADAWGSGKGADFWVWFEVTRRTQSPALVERSSDGDELLDIRMAVESMKKHALLALDSLGNVTNWGAGPTALTGFTAEQMLGHHVSEIYVPASRSAFTRERETAETIGWYRSERWIRRSDDSQFWAEIDLAPIRDRALNQRGLAMLISDVTDRKSETDELEHMVKDLREQALTDDVTGLANRRQWMQEVHRALARSRRQQTPLAVAMLDLDQFKAYNDTHGHPAGDELLKSVAVNWAGAVRTGDMLARYGGDEFAITLPDCQPELALTVIGRVQAATPTATGASAGIAHVTDSDTAETIVERADQALYEAKRSGKSIAVADTSTEDRA